MGYSHSESVEPALDTSGVIESRSRTHSGEQDWNSAPMHQSNHTFTTDTRKATAKARPHRPDADRKRSTIHDVRSEFQLTPSREDELDWDSAFS